MAIYMIDNQLDKIDFEIKMDQPIERTLRNAKNLLLTRRGEVPYDRLRGFNADLYDEPLTVLNSHLVAELDKTMLWEPDVDVHDAIATLDENGEIYIRVWLNIDIEE